MSEASRKVRSTSSEDDVDFERVVPSPFEMAGDLEVVDYTLPDDVRDAAWAAAQARGISYQDFMRDAVKKAS